MVVSTIKTSVIQSECIKKNQSKTAKAEALVAEALRANKEAKFARTRLTEVKKVQSECINKEKKNKNAEAEALTAEAVRVANEAKFARARLAEVKKAMSMFAKKLDNEQQPVQKEVKKPKPVVAGHNVRKDSFVEKKKLVVVAEAPVVEEPVEENSITEEPTTEKLVTVEIPSKELREEKPSVQEPVELVKKEHSPVGDEEVEKEPIEEKIPIFALVEGTDKDDPTKEEPMKDTPVAVDEGESKPDFIKSTPSIERQLTGIVSEKVVCNDVVKIVQTNPVTLRPIRAPKPSKHGNRKNPSNVIEPTSARKQEIPVHTPVVMHPVTLEVVEDYDKDIFEQFLDSLGVDELCGVDDRTLGAVREPSPLVENPNHAEIDGGLDDGNVFICGEFADLCEPPDLEEEYVVPQQYAVRS